MIKPAPRVVIAGTGSGCGKTTTVCAILQALKNRGLSPMSFKCGPDYIDPMFHSGIIGVDSANLDIFFAGEAGVRSAFVRHAADVNVVEGVMGMYDGLAMDSDVSSSYHLARVLDAPVVLVLNVRGMALSAAAAVKGYMTLRSPNVVRGVIFNKVSPMTYPSLSKVVEKECGIPVLGYLPDLPECSLESRHLGLVTAAEVSELQSKMQRLAEAAEKTLDLPGILALAETASELPTASLPVLPDLRGFRLGVALDEAFHFYYEANLDTLKSCGAELSFFSPLHDPVLPPALDGLYIGGGYPEVYAKELEANASMRESVQMALARGLRCYSECGGLLYLSQSLDGCAMCGFLPIICRMTDRLQHFGYVTVTDRTGLVFPAHEFHRTVAEPAEEIRMAYTVRKMKGNGEVWRCGYEKENTLAAFAHVHFADRPELIRRFWL